MHYRELVAGLAAAIMIGSISEPCCAEPLNYSHLDLSIGMQNTLGLEGGSFDSDDSFQIAGSYLVHKNVFIWGRYDQSGYDLDGFHDAAGNFPPTDDDMSIREGSFGLGLRARISPDTALPVDGFIALSYEFNQTKLRAKLSKNHPETWADSQPFDSSMFWNGAGLKVGINAQLAPNIELHALAYEQSYGPDLITRRGGLDGLSYDIGLAVKISEHVDLTVSYDTGELDYQRLEPLIQKFKEIEVDRDRYWLGARYCF